MLENYEQHKSLSKSLRSIKIDSYDKFYIFFIFSIVQDTSSGK